MDGVSDALRVGGAGLLGGGGRARGAGSVTDALLNAPSPSLASAASAFCCTNCLNGTGGFPGGFLATGEVESRGPPMLFNFAAATFWAIMSRTDGRLVGGGGAGLWWFFAGDTRGGFAIGLGLGGGTLGLGLGGGTRAAGALSPPWLNIDDIAATLEERPVGEGVTLAVFFHAGVVLATVPAVPAVLAFAATTGGFLAVGCAGADVCAGPPCCSWCSCCRQGNAVVPEGVLPSAVACAASFLA